MIENKDTELWYKEIMEQFEKDSKKHDFSISLEWDWDFRCAMGIVELDECLAHAEQINRGNGTAEQKAKQRAQIMSAMERRFDIPILRDLAWESENQEVIVAYRKISKMRKW